MSFGSDLRSKKFQSSHAHLCFFVVFWSWWLHFAKYPCPPLLICCLLVLYCYILLLYCVVYSGLMWGYFVTIGSTLFTKVFLFSVLEEPAGQVFLFPPVNREYLSLPPPPPHTPPPPSPPPHPSPPQHHLQIQSPREKIYTKNLN